MIETPTIEDPGEASLESLYCLDKMLRLQTLWWIVLCMSVLLRPMYCLTRALYTHIYPHILLLISASNW